MKRIASFWVKSEKIASFWNKSACMLQWQKKKSHVVHTYLFEDSANWLFLILLTIWINSLRTYQTLQKILTLFCLDIFFLRLNLMST